MLIKDIVKYATIVSLSLILSSPIHAKTKVTNKAIAAMLPPGGNIVKGSAPNEFFIIGKNAEKTKIAMDTNKKLAHKDDSKSVQLTSHIKTAINHSSKLSHKSDSKTVAVTNQHHPITTKKVALNNKVHHKAKNGLHVHV